MRKYLFGLLALSMMASASAVMCACGDDDDDEGGSSGSTQVGVVDSKTGLRISQVGSYAYHYQEDGRLDYIEHVGHNTRIQFGYSPNTITYYYSGDEEGKEEVSYNKAGQIATLTEKNAYGSGTAHFSYDGNGYLTKITSSGSYSEVEGGETFSESSSASINFTWKNNLLTKAEWKSTVKWTEGKTSGTNSDSESWELTYDNTDFQNVFSQIAPFYIQALGYDLDDDDALALASYAGLLGNGPAVLPSSATCVSVETEDGESETRTRNYTYQYSFNDDGSISWASNNGSRLSFRYGYVEENSSRARAEFNEDASAVHQHRSLLFGRRLHRK